MKPSILYIDESTIESDRVDSHFYHSKYMINEKKLIKSGLKIVTLGEVISKMNSPIGWQGIPSASYLPKGIGIPLIRVQNVSDLMLDKDTLIGVQEYIYQEQPAIQAEAEDIIITRVGTIGRVCIIPQGIDKIAMGQNLTRIKVDTDIISSEFLTIFMASEYCQLQMRRYAYGGVQPSLTNKNIKQLLIPIPTSEIQKYIGDKVRRAEELREEAKRLKEEAEDTLDRELKLNELHMKLKDSKKKYGWRDIELLKQRIDSDYYADKFIIKEEHLKNHTRENMFLNDLTEVIFTGKKLIENENGEEVCYIQSGDISSNFLDVNNKVKVNTDKLRLLEQKDILLAKDGETIGKLAVNYSDKKLILNEHTYCLRLKQTHKIYSGYIYYLLRNELLNDLIKREATGSAQKGLNQDFTIKIVIPMIDQKIISRLDELEELRCKNIYQSKQLIQQAKQDVEVLIEGNFDMSKLNDTTTESR